MLRRRDNDRSYPYISWRRQRKNNGSHWQCGQGSRARETGVDCPFPENRRLRGSDGLAHVPGITLLPCDQNFGFSWEMSAVQRKAAALYYDNLLRMAWEMAAGLDGDPGFDMLVLDEVLGACGLGFVREDMVIEKLRCKPDGLEVVMTGRGPSDGLMECADYITEMVMGRHPFERGIPAREGIEY